LKPMQSSGLHISDVQPKHTPVVSLDRAPRRAIRRSSGPMMHDLAYRNAFRSFLEETRTPGPSLAQQLGRSRRATSRPR
jgi:hypothetical protein